MACSLGVRRGDDGKGRVKRSAEVEMTKASSVKRSDFCFAPLHQSLASFRFSKYSLLIKCAKFAQIKGCLIWWTRAPTSLLNHTLRDSFITVFVAQTPKPFMILFLNISAIITRGRSSRKEGSVWDGVAFSPSPSSQFYFI